MTRYTLFTFFDRKMKNIAILLKRILTRNEIRINATMRCSKERQSYDTSLHLQTHFGLGDDGGCEVNNTENIIPRFHNKQLSYIFETCFLEKTTTNKNLVISFPQTENWR